LMTAVLVLLAAVTLQFLRQRELQARLASVEVRILNLTARHDRGLAPGAAAPDFQLQTPDGQTLSLDQFKGLRVLLVFASQQCEACERAYPLLQRLGKAHADWQVVLTIRDQELQEPEHSENFSFPVVLWNEATATNYKVSGFPFCTAIDEMGTVIGSDYLTTWESLEALLAAP